MWACAHTHTQCEHVHTHPQRSHTHTPRAHTHTQKTYTHTMRVRAHTHTEDTHTHHTHAHRRHTHTHTMCTHTHHMHAHIHTHTTHTEHTHTHTHIKSLTCSLQHISCCLCTCTWAPGRSGPAGSRWQCSVTAVPVPWSEVALPILPPWWRPLLPAWDGDGMRQSKQQCHILIKVWFTLYTACH